MAASENDSELFRVVAHLEHVNTAEELILWANKDLQMTFRHGAFICGVGKVKRTRFIPIKYFSSNFPTDYLRSIRQSDGLYFSSAITQWLETGEVQLLDSVTTGEMNLDQKWLENFRNSDLQNIAAFGIFDCSHQYGSYFSFHKISEPLGEWHRSFLKFIVPHMHAALLRIIKNLKKTSVSAVRDKSALTQREIEILDWVAVGKTSSEIATILGTSCSTVRNQVHNILVKLRVNTRAQAVAKAINYGLVTSK